MTHQRSPSYKPNPHHPVQVLELQESRHLYPSPTPPIQQGPFYSPVQRPSVKPRVVLRPVKQVRKPLEYEDIYDGRSGAFGGRRYSMREGRRAGGYRAVNGAFRNSGDFTGAHKVRGSQEERWAPSGSNGSIGNRGYIVDPKNIEDTRYIEAQRDAVKNVREVGSSVVNKGGSRNIKDPRNQNDARHVHDGTELQHEHYSRELRPGEVGNNAINLGQVRVIVNDRKETHNRIGGTGIARDISNTEGQTDPPRVAHLRLVVDEKDSTSHHLVPNKKAQDTSYTEEHDRDTRDVGCVRVVVKGNKGSSSGHYVHENSVNMRYMEELKDARGTTAVMKSSEGDYRMNNTRDYIRNLQDPRAERVNGQHKGRVSDKERRELSSTHQLSFPRNLKDNEEAPSSQLLNNEQNEPANQRQHVIASVVTDRGDSPPVPSPHDMPRSVSPAISLGSNASQMTHNSGVSAKSEVSVKSILKKPKVGRIVMKEEPSSFSVLAILACILCFPCGIYALAHSANVKNAVEDSDYEWALSSSKKVKHFCIGVAIAYIGILIIGGGLLAKYLITGKLF